MPTRSRVSAASVNGVAHADILPKRACVSFPRHASRDDHGRKRRALSGNAGGKARSASSPLRIAGRGPAASGWRRGRVTEPFARHCPPQLRWSPSPGGERIQYCTRSAFTPSFANCACTLSGPARCPAPTAMNTVPGCSIRALDPVRPARVAVGQQHLRHLGRVLQLVVHLACQRVGIALRPVVDHRRHRRSSSLGSSSTVLSRNSICAWSRQAAEDSRAAAPRVSSPITGLPAAFAAAVMHLLRPVRRDRSRASTAARPTGCVAASHGLNRSSAFARQAEVGHRLRYTRRAWPAGSRSVSVGAGRARRRSPSPAPASPPGRASTISSTTSSDRVERGLHRLVEPASGRASAHGSSRTDRSSCPCPSPPTAPDRRRCAACAGCGGLLRAGGQRRAPARAPTGDGAERSFSRTNRHPDRGRRIRMTRCRRTLRQCLHSAPLPDAAPSRQSLGAVTDHAALLPAHDPDAPRLLERAGLPDPAALRHGDGRGHLPHRDDAARARARTRGTPPSSSPAAGRPTAAMARTPTGCSIITSIR